MYRYHSLRATFKRERGGLEGPSEGSVYLILIEPDRIESKSRVVVVAPRAIVDSGSPDKIVSDLDCPDKNVYSCISPILY